MGRYLLVSEAAEILRKSDKDVRALIAEGRLRAVRARPKGRLLISPRDLEEALGEARRPSPATACAVV
jgi:excisionase family DNA binding protein